MDLIQIGIQSDKPTSQMIEDAKEAIRNAGYRVGEFEAIDDGEGYIVGNMEIDSTFTAFLSGRGFFEAEYDGTKVDAEWP